jgi:hypothetical protein
VEPELTVWPINATGEEKMFSLVETQHKPSKPQRIVFLPGLILKTLQLPYALYVSVRVPCRFHNKLLLVPYKTLIIGL